MSQENVEIVRRLMALAQEGTQSGDLAPAFDEAVSAGLMSPNCEWRGGPGRGGSVVGVGNEVGAKGIEDFVGRGSKTSRSSHLNSRRSSRPTRTASW
jgi:hypothetical protein